MSEFLTRLLSRTAWPMKAPTPYGTFHLAFFLGGLVCAILLAFLLRRVGERGNRAVLLTVGTFLLLSEIYKQLFYTFYLGGGAYQWWIFPFQLCSVPMYLCFICAFLRPGRVRDGMNNFLLAFNLMGAFVAFLEPSGLVHEYWTLTLHAFLWHMTLVFLGLYLGISRRAGRDWRGFRTAVVTYLALAVCAFCLNLLLWKPAGGEINMFFVGPQKSSIIVFSSIAEKWGWYVATPIYLFACSLGAFLFYLPFVLWNRRLDKRAANRAAAAVPAAPEAERAREPQLK